MVTSKKINEGSHTNTQLYISIYRHYFYSKIRNIYFSCSLKFVLITSVLLYSAHKYIMVFQEHQNITSLERLGENASKKYSDSKRELSKR